MTKLLVAGFIVEVLHTEWLANPVLVEKKKEEEPKAPKVWCMCIDYTNLNKACPKYPFPSPRIDQVIDSTAGCELLSFLDAYSGFHQIPLKKGRSNKNCVHYPARGLLLCHYAFWFEKRWRNIPALHAKMPSR